MKKSSIILLVVFLVVSVFGDDHRPDISITDVGTHEVSTPAYVSSDSEGGDTLYISGMPLQASSRKKWLRFWVEYETRPEWVDRLTIEFYLLMPGDDITLFKGVVHYVDIPEGDEHLAEMYMHFNSYARYYDRGKFTIAVVLKVDGETVAVSEPNSLDNPWWETELVNPCGLLNRLDTPFRIVNVEQYQAQDFCVWE